MQKQGINSLIEVQLSNSSFHLYQLQKVDLRLDQINQRTEKIGQLLSNNPELVETENQVNSTLKMIHEKENELSALEEASSKKKIKIEQSEASLYNGKISNPKELKDLQTEIVSLKKAISSIEDDQLILMAQLEEYNQILQQNQKVHDSVLINSQQDGQKLLSEIDELNKEKEKLIKERQAATGQIQAESLRIYENLRNSKNHIAVAIIDDQCCATCGSEITASDIQKARSSSALFFCPSCGRIIYAG